MSDNKQTKSEEAKSTKNAATLAKAAAVNLESSLAGITKASLEAQEAFADIGKRLITKYEELGAVEEAIKLKKEDLKLLHGQDKLLKEISELEAEKTKIEAANKQLEEDLSISIAREDADYQYNLLRTRKAEADLWSESVRVRNNSERDRQEAFEKDLKFRNDVLQAQEKDYKDAIAKLATFEDELAKRINAEVGKEKAILTSKFEADKKLIEVTHKAEISGLQKDIGHALETIVSKDATIANLQEQLKTALEAQTSLAKATVEGANDKKSLAEMQGIVATVGSNGARRPS